MQPILSLNDVASRLGYSREQLELVASEIDGERRARHYGWKPLWESGCVVRQLRVPRPHLKEIQTRIKKNIFDRIPVSENAHGSVKGRSSKTNAEPHLGQRGRLGRINARDGFGIEHVLNPRRVGVFHA